MSVKVACTKSSQIDLAKKVTTSHRLLQGSLPTAFLSHLLRTETSADGLDPGSCEGASTSSAHATLWSLSPSGIASPLHYQTDVGIGKKAIEKAGWKDLNSSSPSRCSFSSPAYNSRRSPTSLDLPRRTTRSSFILPRIYFPT